jgi:poly-gamma-glutamate synthesis protein (capsule biosynthesis protein)
VQYQAEAGNIHMVLTGDSLVTQPLSMYTEPAYLSLVELLRGADVAVTNAEMLFHDYEHPPTTTPGGTYMHASPRIIDELQWLGINMVAAANNHNYDYGENGLLTHLHNLQKSGLVHAGIGRSLGEARSPAYLDTAAGRVALISATSSGPPGLRAAHQWRDGMGRPGANMIRYTSTYTVNQQVFEALRILRDEFRLNDPVRNLRRAFGNHSWGQSDIPDTETAFYLADLHDEWQYPVPNGYRFELGDSFSRLLVPNAADIEENLQRISDARRSADWVIVTLHNHESGATGDDPSNVAVHYAHAAIDAGADVFHGHGPHRDRGIEIYKGKPIFYSLGHLIQQNDMIDRVPAENLLRQGLDPNLATPADFFDSRSGKESVDEWAGAANTLGRWQDVVAVVEFTGKTLSGVTLQPIDLGFKRPRYTRGRPQLAEGAAAQDVLTLIQRLSKPFGTDIEISGDVGRVRVSDKNVPSPGFAQ